jgi:cell shape-determining protein MreD
MLFPLLIISILLEGTITTLPLVIICLLCWTIVRRDTSVFPAAFFAGLLLDTLTVHRVGGASIFLLALVFLILLYQRKYEINSYPFVLAASFLGSGLFLMVFSYNNVLLQAMIGSLIAVVLFAVLNYTHKITKSK